MLRYRAGDAGAFEALYRRHRAPLYRYLRRQCASNAIADELFQDVWMRLIAARGRYRVEAKFTTYLYRIAHNRLVDHYRQRGNASGDVDPEPDPPEPRDDARSVRKEKEEAPPPPAPPAGASRAMSEERVAPGAADSAEPRRQDGPDAMLAEVRRLVAAGQTAEARDLLERLRERFPEAPIPDDLLRRLGPAGGSPANPDG